MSDATPIKAIGETYLLPEGTTAHDLTELISGVTENKAPRGWWVLFTLALLLLGLMTVCIAYVLYMGIGVWGNNSPVFWAWDITNFVWWIGIGHAGTLISAILYLFRQKWRTSINRFAEAMTVFAVLCAGLFPALHTGRPWFDYYLFPIPNQMAMWPNFKSPLMWDVFAVSTYLTISVIFWYVGLIPDLATVRDRSRSLLRKRIYGFLALGWRGSHRGWQHYERAYLIFAGISTPLVLSVHSVVSMDFATSVLPGWHTTIFPPYFVAGAIFGGFAMVVTLAVPARQFFGLKRVISIKHLELMNKIILATGTMVGYAYGIEFFIAWYGGGEYEGFAFINRTMGNYSWAYWTMVTCNVITPQIHWFKKARTNVWVTLAVGVIVNVGMWFERFVIVVSSLARDYLPSSWGYFVPSAWDFATLAGSFGLFFTLFLLFCRYLPMVAMAEVKAAIPAAHAHGDEH